MERSLPPSLPLAAAALAAAFLLAGCVLGPERERREDLSCAERPHEEATWFLAAGRLLQEEPGPEGSEPADQGHASFASELAPWLSQPIASGLHAEGSVRVRLTVTVEGQNPFQPTPDGTLLLLQFGSDRTFSPWSAAVRNGDVLTAGARHEVDVEIPLPPGGFTVEPGERLALLVTSLAEGAGGPGATIHHGGATGSSIRLSASCADARAWAPLDAKEVPVELPANTGLFTGAIPPQEGLNRLTVPFELAEGTGRLTIALAQANASGPKDDMDIYLQTTEGDVLWQAASPAADERMVLWPENLDVLPRHVYEVRVDSYGGAGYTGSLTIVQEAQRPAA